MMLTLESEAISRRMTELTLRSTRGAHGFYLRLGFVDSEPARRGRFITAQPMRKLLTRSASTG